MYVGKEKTVSSISTKRKIFSDNLICYGEYGICALLKFIPNNTFLWFCIKNIRYVSGSSDAPPNPECTDHDFSKFMFSKKATKIDEIFSFWHYVVSLKSKIFVAFLENMNFNEIFISFLFLFENQDGKKCLYNLFSKLPVCICLKMKATLIFVKIYGWVFHLT